MHLHRPLSCFQLCAHSEVLTNIAFKLKAIINQWFLDTHRSPRRRFLFTLRLSTCPLVLVLSIMLRFAKLLCISTWCETHSHQTIQSFILGNALVLNAYNAFQLNSAVSRSVSCLPPWTPMHTEISKLREASTTITICPLRRMLAKLRCSSVMDSRRLHMTG